MNRPRPPSDITSFALERYSVPNPGKGPSPAKVRNSHLEWMHYENHESAPLVLEVEIRGREPGYQRRVQCLVRVVHGGSRHREINVGQYSEAYDNARTARDERRGMEYDDGDSGSGHYGTMESQDEGPLVDTLRFTVKPPSIAIRTLQPLVQMTSSYYPRNRSAADYTYDRFQVRFAKTQDIPAFLAIIYQHFPALDPEQTATQRIELAESIALSQDTSTYLPDDPYLAIRRPGAVQQPYKRRRVDDESDTYDRQRYDDVEESRRGGQRDAYGRERNDYRPAGPMMYHDRQLPESSYAFPPPLNRHRTSPETQLRQPSFDQDGFAKPLPPAYIDTPTPANRIYHLKQRDPNQKRSDTHRPLAASPKKPTVMASEARHDPFKHGGNISNDLGRRIGVPAGSGETRHSLYLPPVRQQMSCPPTINASIASRPTGNTLPSLPGHPSDMEQIESRHGSSGVVGLSRPERRILAPETVSIAPANQGASAKPWPTVYGSPVSSGSRAGVSAIGDTPDLHHSRVPSPMSLAGGFVGADNHAHMLGRQDRGETSAEDKGYKTAGIQEHAADTRPSHPDIAQDPHTSQHVAEQLTANITQSSSLYALSFEELEDAIDEIITEDGFIPFVEKLSRSWGKRLNMLAEGAQAREGNTRQRQEGSSASANIQRHA